MDIVLVVGSSTLDITSKSGLGALVVGIYTVTADPAGRYLVVGQMLTLSGVITISGTRISLAVPGTSHAVSSITPLP